MNTSPRQKREGRKYGKRGAECGESFVIEKSCFTLFLAARIHPWPKVPRLYAQKAAERCRVPDSNLPQAHSAFLAVERLCLPEATSSLPRCLPPPPLGHHRLVYSTPTTKRGPSSLEDESRVQYRFRVPFPRMRLTSCFTVVYRDTLPSPHGAIVNFMSAHMEGSPSWSRPRIVSYAGKLMSDLCSSVWSDFGRRKRGEYSRIQVEYI